MKFGKGKKRNKYGVAPKADRTLNGITYASKAEMQYAAHLDYLRQGHVVKSIEFQPVFMLEGGIKYVADFRVFNANGTVDVIDVKGVETQVFRLKVRQWKKTPDIGPLTIVKKKGRGFVVDRVIQCKGKST